VRYVKDMTGRFAMRPHYEPAELDRECEQILAAFFGQYPDTNRNRQPGQAH